MKPFFTPGLPKRILISLLFSLFIGLTASAQLGTYQFTGLLIGTCPNLNNGITTQPSNATFSAFTNVGARCSASAYTFDNDHWGGGGGYNTFTVTPNAGYLLTLTSLSFTQYSDGSSVNWSVRSSIDNYTNDLATGSVTSSSQTATVNLPSANFTNIGAVTFRIYLIGADNGVVWTNDDVTLYGTVVGLPANPVNPTSNSPQCATSGVTLTATGTPPAGVTWFWETSATGTSTTDFLSTYTVNASGTYYLRAQDNTSLLWSSGAGSITVVATASVGTPVFTLGGTSTRCQASGNVTYTATATNSTGITYSLDGSSIAGGNSINASTGVVTYAAGWSGTSVITASAAGCSGPLTASHTVTITPVVTTPVFGLGGTSTRCQGAGTVTYTATATNSTGITYTLDAASITGLNSINASTGVVTYAAGWSGTSTITATAAGCTPKTATHVVTVTPTVGTPVFSLGSTSTRCQVATTITYTATATNNTGITYSLDATSLAAGNTINASTGAVTYDSNWNGTSVITASAAGCNGPKTSIHTVTTNAPVTSPVFSLGSTSTRCQGAGNVTYASTATNSTGITYSLDATTDAFVGNSINTSTGVVTYAAGWTGTSTVTASAAGCSGPLTTIHTITTTPYVGTPVFALGATSTRCQGAGTVNYTATATNTTGITYSLNAPSITAGNTINSATGDVTYVAGYNGTTIITASAAGCSGPKTATHTVTVTASVGTPVFTLGGTSTRCQASGNVTYTATATNSTGITYSLDGSSIAGGNSINASTGVVTYAAGWSGTSVITASAAGCSGPLTASHTVTITPVVTTPVFGLGGTSTRCQGAGTVTYTATATNSTGITYTLDAASITGLNSINASTGVVTYAAGWSGTSTITATAAGCTPKTATHVVTVTPTVGTPVFSLGSTSTRCQVATTITYTATATNNTGITYSLDATSLAAGNTINASTGAVTYDSNWNGTSVITASAAGCNGPKTSIHTVTTNAPVTSPVFSLGSTSTRCQGAGNVTYTATATNSTGITYSLDATTDAFVGNSINTSTGVVTYAAGWTGTSTVTASAAGCSGPLTTIHTITTTPYVGTPVFALGATSTRCQGAGTVNYTATATNTTGITYSLNAPSITAGNTINSATGDVTYVAGYSGTTIITASAAGCSGPKTATHTVTVTASVGTPVFTLGGTSSRTQGAGTVTYTASATTTTGITYSLDASSIAGGNSINASTGVVTYAAGWSGTSVITASAAGCSGPKTATHIVTINATTAIVPLYLSDPSQALDRVDPVATADNTTASTGILSKTGTATTTFTQATALFSGLTIKAGTISVKNYITVATGTMPANPAITAQIKYGSVTIINLTNPTYNSGTGLLTWTGTLASDVTVPSGEAILLQITTAEANANFTIDFDSQTKPSKIDLPVSSFINITTFGTYTAPYPGGTHIINGVSNTPAYLRAIVTAPFGSADVASMDITITPNGNTVSAPSVASTATTKVFEYPWTLPAINGNLTILGTAKEGYESTISNAQNIVFNLCSTCPPVAYNDSVSGAGGAPILIDVLANDYDPNNNINANSLAIISMPTNGDAVLSGGKIVYIPNGTFSGTDQFTYQICDSTGLCATAIVSVTIDPTIVDPCSEATKSHVYYIPYPETDARTALIASANNGLAITNLRDIISLKMPYPNMTVIWDQWEDGYETDIQNPQQSTTQIWGDGNPYNGIAPGYPNDIIPAGGSIVLDNTVPSNPRVASNLFYDGKDKVFSNGQISIVQVIGEPSVIGLQCMKTNVAATEDFGRSFTVPVGQNFPSQDFAYTALFIRASENNTIVNIDKDNNGVYETTDTLNQGQSVLINGGVLTGATITSSAPIGVDLHFGGIDSYSSREVPLYPASWYSSTYYSPVPTTGASTAVKDTAVVMLYNSLSRPITIDWYSGAPSNGSIVLPAKTVKRFALPLSATAAYKFVNPTGESFTAIEIVDSYTPGGGGNSGSTYDWAFNLISEERLTPFATLAWAPGSTDGTRDDNPIWVTPAANTTIYVKYNGDLTTGGSASPCGLHYDVSYPLNALNHKRLKDLSDNDQGGLAVYTCDGTKIAAVYGEDPSTASTANPSWDVGSTMRPFCSLKLMFANDDYAFTVTDNPVTIPILKNDVGFAAIIDPTSVITNGLLQPKHGTVIINTNGTVLYTPNPGYQGKDTFEYSVCSTPSPIVCDIATVYVTINSCPPPASRNILYGKVFWDKAKTGVYNPGNPGFPSSKVYLYTDGNCNSVIDPHELTDSVTVDSSGTYQFITYPEKTVSDGFDGTGGTSTCSSGSNGNTGWAGNWVDAGDPSTGFCVTPAVAISNTHAEIVKDGAFGYGIRLKYKNISASRAVNLSGATYAFLTFSYRRTSATQIAGHDIYVQVSSNGTAFTTVYTIQGDGTTDAGYVKIYNQDISSYTSATTVIRFLTNSSMGLADSVYIDDVSVRYLKYPQCYIVKVPQTTWPSNFYMTTSSQSSITFSGSGSCASPMDFGVSSLTTLPINLLKFNGYASGYDDILNWSTEQEINSSRFEIETKTDTTNFAKLGAVNAKGTSAVKSTYSFVNHNAPKGNNYYRLKVIDKDGKFTYSDIIVLKRSVSGVVLNQVYPNPFKDKIVATITLDKTESLHADIYDANGVLIKREALQGVKGTNIFTITGLEKYASGVYFFEVKDDNEIFRTKLFKTDK